MSARDIPQDQWTTFFDQFSREHRAWLATVDRLRAGEPEQTEAVERPLASVVPRIAAHRIAGIEIRFQADSPSRESIEIDAPAMVRVHETDGVAQGLDIVDRDGECTRLRFRTAPQAEMLDGIAPGEVPS
jgi:hypothetical protein